MAYGLDQRLKTDSFNDILMVKKNNVRGGKPYMYVVTRMLFLQSAIIKEKHDEKDKIYTWASESFDPFCYLILAIKKYMRQMLFIHFSWDSVV